MENNTNQNFGVPVNPVPSTVPAQVQGTHSCKGSFWKGYALGILTAIILAFIVLFILSLLVVAPARNNAQVKGNVAAVRATLSNLRAQAELYADGNNVSYAGVCQSQMFATTILNLKDKTVKGDVVCNDTAKKFVVAATVQDADGIKTACVDSTGVTVLNSGKASESAAVKNYSCL